MSRYGLVAYGSSLDQIGPVTQTVEDCALMLNVIAGHDAADSTSVDEKTAPVSDYLAKLDEPVKGLRIGIASSLNAGADGEVRKAIDEAIQIYKKLGGKLIEIDMPHFDYAIAAYYMVATAEASSNLARYDGVHYGHQDKKPE